MTHATFPSMTRNNPRYYNNNNAQQHFIQYVTLPSRKQVKETMDSILINNNKESELLELEKNYKDQLYFKQNTPDTKKYKTALDVTYDDSETIINPALQRIASLGLVETIKGHFDNSENDNSENPDPLDTEIHQKMKETAMQVAEEFQKYVNNPESFKIKPSLETLQEKILGDDDDINNAYSLLHYLQIDTINHTAKIFSEKNLKEEIEKFETKEASKFVEDEYLAELQEQELDAQPFLENEDLLPKMSEKTDDKIIETFEDVTPQEEEERRDYTLKELLVDFDMADAKNLVAFLDEGSNTDKLKETENEIQETKSDSNMDSQVLNQSKITQESEQETPVQDIDDIVNATRRLAEEISQLKSETMMPEIVPVDSYNDGIVPYDDIITNYNLQRKKDSSLDDYYYDAEVD